MKINQLYVVGSGAMGSGIAQTAITHGIEVMMNDISPELIEKGYFKIKQNLEKAVAKNRMTEDEMRDALGRLCITVELEDAKTADFVIEAATENRQIKLDIFKKLDEI